MAERKGADGGGKVQERITGGTINSHVEHGAATLAEPRAAFSEVHTTAISGMLIEVHALVFVFPGRSHYRTMAA